MSLCVVFIKKTNSNLRGRRGLLLNLQAPAVGFSGKKPKPQTMHRKAKIYLPPLLLAAAAAAAAFHCLNMAAGKESSDIPSFSRLEAKRGRLALEAASADMLYSLEGEWEHYPGQLLGPSAFGTAEQGADSPPEFLRIPHKLPGNGKLQYGTLRLIVQAPAPLEHYTLSSGLVYSASKAWVNGNPAWQNGEVAASTTEYAPLVRRSVVQLPASNRLELIVQYSNLDLNAAGIAEPPQLGTPAAHLGHRQAFEFVNAVLLGVTFSLLLYNLFSLAFDPRRAANQWLLLLSACIFLKILLQFSTAHFQEMFLVSDLTAAFALNFAVYYGIVGSGFLVMQAMLPNLFNYHVRNLLLVIFPVLYFRLAALKPYQYYRDIDLAHATAVFLIAWIIIRSFTSPRGRIRFKAEVSIGFALLAATCIPAIVAHARLSPAAMILENITYLNVVFVVTYLRSMHLKVSNDRIKDEIKKRRHAYTQLVKMVYPHQLRLIQDGKSLEETLPTGSQEDCCVICFDIVESSKIPDGRALMSEIFSECFALMTADYDDKSITAAAYRINEVGDGFFCSIGFPFRTGREASNVEVAWALARGFLDTVESVNRRRAGMAPVKCSIGIACGELAGFFTAGNIKRYDMYGEAIVLSTRYENMRKVISTALTGGRDDHHVIVLQSKVAERLPQSELSSLHKVFLPALNMKVRNDEQADALYCLYVPCAQQAARAG